MTKYQFITYINKYLSEICQNKFKTNRNVYKLKTKEKRFKHQLKQENQTKTC